MLDFSAGKDVGIGLFGHDGTSTINAGIRMMDIKEGSISQYLRAAAGEIRAGAAEILSSPTSPSRINTR